MAILKIVFMIAITMAVTLTLTLKTLGTYGNEFYSGISTEFPTKQTVKMPKRISRFLVEQSTNSRAADHCHKDNEICYIFEGKNSTCCNNKCMDLSNDKNNCGTCKNKCIKYTDSCCGGKCVDLAYDTGNCGECGKKCQNGKSCKHGTCDYA